MNITIIIPQFNRPELTAACIASLRQHETTRWPLLVVDDGSAPSHRELTPRPTEPATRFISVRHRGVTAAWNVGIRLARTPLVLLVNNDVLWQGPAVADLIEPLLTSTASATGAAWRVETRWPARCEDPAGTRRLLAGWCLVFRRDRWQDLGGFDEHLQLYFSDTDFQLRLRQTSPTPADALMQVDVPLVHAGHQTTRGCSDRRRQWGEDGRRFSEKWA